MDAVAIGQVTRGPVFTTATFVSYVLHGTPGALVANLPTSLVALASLVLLVRFRVNSTWLVLGGAIVGLLLTARG